MRTAFDLARAGIGLATPNPVVGAVVVDSSGKKAGEGTHTYEGVKRDFELFAPLVQPGGLIAFHDVNESNWPGVIKLWNEIKPRHETLEFVAEDPPGRYGIGVVVVRDGT